MASEIYIVTILNIMSIVFFSFVCYKSIVAYQHRHERLRQAELAQVASGNNTQNIATVTNAVPSFQYVAPPHRGDEEAPESPMVVPECVICLGKVVDGEVVKALPNCMHMFHADCIDMWLFSHQTCPVCRSPVPPSSVVPVAS